MSKPKWDQHEILAALRRRGMTMAKLAEINGINPGYFRQVWTRTNRKAEAAIAAFLDVPVEELSETATPIRSARILSSKYDDAGASQKSSVSADMRSAA